MASKYERLRSYEGRDGVSVVVPTSEASPVSLVFVVVFLGMMALVIPFVPVLGTLLAAAAVVYAFRERTEREWIQDSPVEDVESLSLGPSAVVGRVAPVEGEAFTAPFTDEPCVLADWEIEDDFGKDERTVDDGVDVRPFYLDDGTGKVLVRPDPDRARILFGSGDFEGDSPGLLYRLGVRGPITERITVAANAATPDRIAEFLDERGLGYGSTERNYRQRLIRPGEDVYVFGLLQRRDGERSASNEENLVFQPAPPGREDQEPAFVVSTISRAKLVARRLWFWILIAFGAGVGALNVLVTVLFVVLLIP